MKVFDDYNDILTVDEVCQALSAGKNSVYKMLKDGIIKCYKVGKKYLIPKICLIDFVNKCRQA